MKVATPMLQKSLADNLIWWDTSNGYETTNLRRASEDSREISTVKSMQDLLKTYYDHERTVAVEANGAV